MSRRARVLPGFSLSLGVAVLYLSLVVLLPLSALFFRTAELGWARFTQVVTSGWVAAAVRFTLGASLAAATLDVLIGLLIAWVLGRYTFPFARVLDAVIDLPFALPTAVTGIALSTLYADNGWIGGALADLGFRYPWPVWRGFDHGGWPIGWTVYDRIALAPLGVVLAMCFVGLPFVVRTLQPVIEDLSRDVEESAATLGAGRFRIFRSIVLPELAPALLTGFALALARGLGEYGSVIFISGNLPDTEIASQVIVKMIEVNETGTYADATAVAVLLLGASFVLLLLINLLQRAAARRGAPG
ncbi:sulfate/thiosulfate transporter subunit [Sorangium cellulosum]|uniref:Sulfate/thiosulfate transporter subunit n=1 Tax=Sorangium cellulosum TaxID=56 RepID=A0A2L0FAH0_SORCE|nr:ABC transporter permease subunit [Sorangium cellulosum]AUX48497.1 sulfate/thiosulfate transporter subunit [Sorangium cellulosum]